MIRLEYMSNRHIFTVNGYKTNRNFDSVAGYNK